MGRTILRFSKGQLVRTEMGDLVTITGRLNASEYSGTREIDGKQVLIRETEIVDSFPLPEQMGANDVY